MNLNEVIGKKSERQTKVRGEHSEQQYGFMPRMSNTEAMLGSLLCTSTEKVRIESIPKEELWFCLKTSEVTEACWSCSGHG